MLHRRGGRVAYDACGVIATPADMPHIERLCIICYGLHEALTSHSPDLIAVERVFINRNYNTSLLLGEARGAALACLLHAGVPLLEPTALQIKQSLTGKGRANKEQVALMLRHLLHDMPEVPLPLDSTDALACALAADAMHQQHLASRPTTRRKRKLRDVAARAARKKPEPGQ